ncbi:hypothetical protein XELAEV_18001627mg [Xenopus laevis]|nr:hypothetical protein XELAEV_18001627mg [Xenopus laevis]
MNFNGEFYLTQHCVFLLCRLFHETSEKKLIWEQLRPTKMQLNSFTGSKNDSSIEDGTHLIVCVHGLGGSALDLLLVRPQIESGVTHGKINFLMSCCNQGFTFDDINILSRYLLKEILQHITRKKLIISRISFIGFSLGNLIIRSALSRPEFEGYRGNLHTYLSFGGPHMGLLYPNTFLFKTGLWIEKRLHIGVSVSQMALSDHKDPRQSFLYKLSQKKGKTYGPSFVWLSSVY